MNLGFLVKKILKKSSFRKKQEVSFEEWLLKKGPYPPAKEVKQFIIRNIAGEYGIRTFVETGTYKGEMVYAQFPFFNQIYSIELSESLFNECVKKFRRFPNIKLIQGDSGEVLNRLVPQLSKPSIFWLDAHYSAGITARGNIDCPIEKELDAVGNSNYEHIVVIDDAKDFVGIDGYPTIEGLEEITKRILPTYKFHLVGGIFFLIPINFKSSQLLDEMERKLNLINS